MKNNRTKTTLNYILRTLFGCVFIFSGFVKAVDPMGTAYKIAEYMNVFGFASLADNVWGLPLFLSICLCSIEFLIGVTMLLHIYNKVNRWTAAVFMIVFTTLTLVDALTNNVNDCGCFGDAVKLTNWQTFFKNIVLDIILVGIFLCDNNKKQDFFAKKNCITFIIFLLLIILFGIRNVMYEPCIDFRPWKVGNKMAPLPNEQQPPVSYALYKNNSTGKEKEFSMDSLMAECKKDTNFQQHWTFISSRFINPNTIKADGFSLLTFGGTEDESLELLSDTTSDLYIIAAVNLHKASDKGMKRIAKYVKDKFEKGSKVVLITSSLQESWYDFQEKYNLTNYLFYSCDDKAIEAMIRSNPGVVHIEKAVVKEKYSWRELDD